MTGRALAGLLCCSVLASSCRRPPGVREARDFERMRRQQRYDAYDASAVFANGAVMQAPPAHTVTRGDDSSTAAPVDGAQQFAISCAPCHGAGGFGGGSIAPNLGEKRPPSLRSSRVASLDSAALIQVITAGIGRMPPLGWQLSPAKRAAVARFVRGLATTPSTHATRDDSAMADYLARVDSLAASASAVRQILQLRRPP